MNRKKFLWLLLSVALLSLVPPAQADWDPEDGFKMHYPQIPDPQGWDVCFRHLVLADDFQCSENGLINDIHFWISWRNDLVDLEAIMGWDLSIWSDNQGRPGHPLWHYRQANVAYRPVGLAEQGWLCPCNPLDATLVAIPEDHTACTQVNLTDIDDPFYQEQGKTYWLVIRAMVPVADTASPQVEIGWKTTIEQTQWGSGAVWARWPFDTSQGWRPILGPDGQPEHLAFVINGKPLPPMDFGDTPQDRCTEDDPSIARCCNYPTTLACNGARHIINPGVYLGDPYTDVVHIDAEPDGQPSLLADGDDNNGADDEDGVTLPKTLVAGTIAQAEILVSTDGHIDAWIDFNGDGDWDDRGERIFYNEPVKTGSNILSFLVAAPPVEPPLLETYGRFRFSRQGNLNYYGLARDGEVEDYKVTVLTEPQPHLDFGDAPDGDFVPGGYPTLMLNNGARHRINPWVHLGRYIDGELDGQPSNGADGDDLDSNIDDEDGVFFHGPLVQGETAEVIVIASVPGWLYAWIDFNQNESWAENHDRIFNGKWLDAGINRLKFPVPITSLTNIVTYARFRFTTTEAILSYDGPAGDGEVEDYIVRILPPDIDFDFGDAPDQSVAHPGVAPFRYPTQLGDNGARHRVDPGIYLGHPYTDCIHIDAEPNGLPSLAADGDDNHQADDEDGIEFLTKLVPGFAAKVLVMTSTEGYIDAWIDFNADGDWDDFREQIFASEPVTAGFNHLEFKIPPYPHAIPRNLPTYARFRFSTHGHLRYEGPARNGEVEDYQIRIEEPPLDAELGDAPDSTNSYGEGMTAYPSDGMLPVTVPAYFPTVYRLGSPPYGPIHWHCGAVHLGPRVSVEVEADLGFDQDPTNNILPERDLANLDKADDGVRVPLALPRCRPTRFSYVVTVNRPVRELYVNVWFDWNRDGDWDDVMACPHLMPNHVDAVNADVEEICRTREWAVRNQVLTDLEPGIYRFITPRFLPWHPLDSAGVPTRPIWMRITVSEKPWHPLSVADIRGIGGSGPRLGYLLGETEDYYFVPKPYRPLIADLNGDGITSLPDLAIMANEWLETIGN